MNAQLEDRRQIIENCRTIIGTIFRIARGREEPLADSETIEFAFGDCPTSELIRHRDGSFYLHDAAVGVCFTLIGQRFFGGKVAEPSDNFRLPDRTLGLVRLRLLQRLEGLEADLVLGKHLPVVTDDPSEYTEMIFPAGLR